MVARKQAQAAVKQVDLAEDQLSVTVSSAEKAAKQAEAYAGA
jgi:hypothetical protein